MRYTNVVRNIYLPVEVEAPTERKPPEKCVFCSNKIEDGDYYYIGFTPGRVYAETCVEYHCTKWYEYKSKKLRKIVPNQS